MARASAPPPDDAAAPQEKPAPEPSDFRMKPVGERMIEARRSYDAYLHDLFQMLTDPEKVAQWRGAPDMPLTTCEIDAQPGGRFRLAWTLPDGSKSWVAGTYLEVSETRIRHTEIYRPDWTRGETQVALDLADHEKRAHLRMRIAYLDAKARDAAFAVLSGGGLQAGLDRLDALF